MNELIDFEMRIEFAAHTEGASNSEKRAHYDTIFWKMLSAFSDAGFFVYRSLPWEPRVLYHCEEDVKCENVFRAEVYHSVIEGTASKEDIDRIAEVIEGIPEVTFISLTYTSNE